MVCAICAVSGREGERGRRSGEKPTQGDPTRARSPPSKCCLVRSLRRSAPATRFPQPSVCSTRAPSCVRTARNSVHACVAGGLCRLGASSSGAQRTALAVVSARAVGAPSESDLEAASSGVRRRCARNRVRRARPTAVASPWKCGGLALLKFDEAEQGRVRQGRQDHADLRVPARDGGGGAGAQPLQRGAAARPLRRPRRRGAARLAGAPF